MKTLPNLTKVLLGVFLGVWTSFTATAATYTLTINANGSGTVSRNPALSAYPGGGVVTLTAQPADRWMFTGWAGDLDGVANPINLTIDGDKSVTANFAEIPIYALTVTVAGQGSVDPPGGAFQSNSVVTLTASPAAGWRFNRWTGNASGNANPLSLTVNRPLDVEAVFVQVPRIVQQPQSAQVALGNPVSFEVVAEGTPPLSYVWQLHGTVLPGFDQSTLTIPSVEATDAGDYQVIVSSPYGSVTSEAAALRISDDCSGPNVVRQCEEAALREAIGRGGTVQICCNGTINLAATIDIASSVTLEGGAHAVSISGNQAVRLFKVAPDVTFEVRNLTLANGTHAGTNGANRSAGEVGSGEDAAGGAVYNNRGTVRLVSCILSNNAAVGGNGGADFDGSAPGPGGSARGGAVFNNGGVVLFESSLAVSNVSQGGFGGSMVLPAHGANGPGFGGALASSGGAIYITNSALMGNRVTVRLSLPSPSPARGGALFIESGLLTLTKSTLIGNHAFGGQNPGSSDNAASAFGGALAVGSGTVVVDGSIFLTNKAQGGSGFRYNGNGDGQGGAIHSFGEILVRDSTISANEALGGQSRSRNGAGLGGGVYNGGTMTLTGTTLDRNLGKGGRWFETFTDPDAGADAAGGGIYNIGSLNATNCTLALNLSEAGWSYTSGATAYGGGAFNGGGTMDLMNVTFASNGVVRAYSGLPIGDSPAPQGANLAITNGVLTLRNSLVAYGLAFSNSHPASSGIPVVFTGIFSNASGTITDGGFNMSSDGSCNFQSGSSFNFTDPKLAALADNGGPTLTMALLPDSPAIDFGTTVGAPSVDQRGFARPSGQGTDIGAYEAGPSPALRLAVERNGSMLEVSFLAQAGITYELQSSLEFTSWTVLETIGPVAANGTVSRTSPLTDPQRFFRVRTKP